MNTTYRMQSGLCAMLVAMMLGGCTTTPALDSKFGSAVSGAIVGQTLYQDAPRSGGPALGLDGVAATNVITRYHKSFASPPPPPNVFAIGVASGPSAAPAPSQQ